MPTSPTEGEGAEGAGDPLPWTRYLVAAISRSGTRTLLARGPATSQPGRGDQERLVEASTCSRASVVIMCIISDE